MNDSHPSPQEAPRDLSPNDTTPIGLRPDVPRKAPDESPGILAKPGVIKRWMRILAAAAVLLLLVDLVYTQHFHADVEAGGGIFGFYGLYGFLGLVVLVLGAKALRLVVMRPEDYYDE